MLKLRSTVCIVCATAGLALAGGVATCTAEAVTPAVQVAAARSDTAIWPRATLYRNQAWTSGNGRAILRLQEDGNLVLYKNGWPVWQAPNSWGRGDSAVFQEDGNFVVYDSAGSPIWASQTWQRGAFLAIQDDGNVVIYDSGRSPVWATNTGD
ncbi:hypothetical protein AB0F17_37450 [Nonomuraea sp. NPDC026600]|uniref:hypothetical protein n=1 Tax=Nonomuraea sp. NPDC026600 TaxID=3155363 RepID=UPI0033F4A785